MNVILFSGKMDQLFEKWIVRNLESFWDVQPLDVPGAAKTQEFPKDSIEQVA